MKSMSSVVKRVVEQHDPNALAKLIKQVDDAYSEWSSVVDAPYTGADSAMASRVRSVAQKLIDRIRSVIEFTGSIG